MEEEQQELIKSVVEFTGTSHAMAEKLLKESNWNVPEAVTRFFIQVDAVPALNERLSPESWSVGSLFSSLVMAVKSCMGWAYASLHKAFRVLFLSGSMTPPGAGTLIDHFPTLANSMHPRCFQGSFQQAVGFSRQSDPRKVVVLFIHSSSAPDLQHCIGIFCQESLVDMLNAQFVFWSGDSDFFQTSNLMRAFSLRSTPAVIAVVANNLTELKVVSACAGNAFTPENVLGVLQKAQEEQDRLAAEAEQFKINRSLREAQDREYQEALERDALLEAERERLALQSISKQEAKASRLRTSANTKLELFHKFLALPLPQTPTTIVVRLPRGVRIERKFDITDRISILYDWVLCSGNLYSHTAEVMQNIHPGSFKLATSFPSKTLDDMESTLEELNLYPNAVLIFTRCDDDSENE